MLFKNAHFLTIFQHAGKYFAFLIIPVIRALMSAGDGFVYWLSGAWIDMTIIFLTIGFSILRWRSFKYFFDKKHIIIKKGVFFKREIIIKFSNISTYTIKNKFFFKPFGASNVYLDTDGGVYGRNDVSIIIKTAEGSLLKNALNKDMCRAGHKESLIKKYKCQTKYVLLISAIMSNTLLGIVLASIFIGKAGSIIGTELQSNVLGTLGKLSEPIFAGISPVASAIGYLLLGGWFVGAIYNIVLMSSFLVCRHTKALRVSRGVFTNREYLISTEKINFISVKQTIFTKLIRIYSVYIQSAGYSSKKERFDLIIPAITKREFILTTQMLLKEFKTDIPAKSCLKPRLISIVRFLYFPAFVTSAVIVGYFVAKRAFPQWHELVQLMLIMALVLCLCFFLLRIISFFTTTVGSNGNAIVMCYPKGFKINKVFILKEKVSMYRLKENFFQKPKGFCDFSVYSYGESKCTHKVKSINKAKIKQLLDI